MAERRVENGRLLVEVDVRVGCALPPHPDSSILTGGLRMTWWGAECGMGSSFESLRMSGLEGAGRDLYSGGCECVVETERGRVAERLGGGAAALAAAGRVGV